MTDSNSNNNSRLESIPNVLLADLPLRPSSLQWWHQKGFRSTTQVQQGLQIHSDGSMIQWNQDLNAKSVGVLVSSKKCRCTRPPTTTPRYTKAPHFSTTQARLYREVQTCLEEYADEKPTSVPGKPIFVRGQSAAELVQQFQADTANKATGIITFCQQVDRLLGGSGVSLGELTEISGPPGIGKTQWAMQLAVNVQIPPCFAGVGGSAIYIDTEGSLTPQRCHDMAQHLFHHVSGKYSQTILTRPQMGPLPDWFTVEGLLAGIQVLRVYDVATLDATISTLERLCQTGTAVQRPVQLIVVDSLAFPVRAESTHDFVGRTQQLTQWAMKLSQLAQSHPRKAVVVVNQMTTTNNNNNIADVTGNKENNSGASTLTPALGEAWAHAVTNRIVLGHGAGDTRICRLVKSPRLPSGHAEYAVGEQGIRDAVYVHGSM